MKTLTMCLLLLTSCSAGNQSGNAGAKGFSAHACVVQIDPSKVVCDSDAPGSGYEDALDAVKNSPKY